jgi:hypothetical protein
MNEDRPDITSLKNAVLALQKSIAVYEKYCDTDIDLSEVLCAGVIHNFKVAYILWPLLQPKQFLSCATKVSERSHHGNIKRIRCITV